MKPAPRPGTEARNERGLAQKPGGPGFESPRRDHSPRPPTSNLLPKISLGDEAVEMELVEVYEVLGVKRYVVQIKGTNIKVNVSASNSKEAVEKARRLLFG